jgi:cobalt/nickel transport system permease protein
MPKAALLTAAFFVTSLIHIPVPPVSIHLVLNGLMGIILGYYAFPAILIGLFFQAVMFGHGGLSSLGVNAIIMGIPALLAAGIYQFALRVTLPQTWQRRGYLFLAGAAALLGSAFLFLLLTLTSITPDLNATLERQALSLALIGYGIQAVLEGILTVMTLDFLQRVRPEVLASESSDSPPETPC